MLRPLLFCNIGWMLEYQGQTASDKIIGGGRYVEVKKRGHEVCNFLSSGGSVYGHVQPVGKQIKLEKLGATKGAGHISGVDVVVTAHRPLGNTVVVGWYHNATVYREAQKLNYPTECHSENSIDSFRYEAREQDVKLLNPDLRTTVVPRGKGGMGRSNVWYAEEAPASWLADVRKLIDGGANLGRRSRKGSSPDVFKNSQVEAAAMDHVWRHYEERGYKLKDVSSENLGWDLEANSGLLTLRIEVKGLSGKAESVELTPNEYSAFLGNRLQYRLCIVTSCLSEPYLSVCSFNLASECWEAESGSGKRRIAIKERVAAQISLKNS